MSRWCSNQLSYAPNAGRILYRTGIQGNCYFNCWRLNNSLSEIWPSYGPRVAIFTGMHTPELFGLKWKYVDFIRQKIHIRETVIDQEDTPRLTAPSER